MVDNELHTCCSLCDTPNIEVFTEKEDDFMTGDILIHQSIRCTHEKICYKIREEQGGCRPNNQSTRKADAIEKFAHNLKETFNNEFPSNYHCTQPYFTLDNVRVLVDLVAKEQNK